MTETITLGDTVIQVNRKSVKNIHLTVHPPNGRVSMTVPVKTRLDVARAYAISKLAWIKEQQRTLNHQSRETPRQFITRESHYLWGRRYLLEVIEQDSKPYVSIDHKLIRLYTSPGSTTQQRAAIIHDWHKALLHEFIPPLISKWQVILGVTVKAWFLQRMKTKWGSCKPDTGHIRLNTELVKKPKDLVEYVLVHEMLHLIEPTHNDHFIALLDKHYPSWREARAELNDLPLSAEEWKE